LLLEKYFKKYTQTR